MSREFREIRPQRRPSQPRSSLPTRVMGMAVTLMMRRPGQVMFSATAAALGAAILLNALALQTKRHPAPMFAAAPAAVAVAKPLVRPAEPVANTKTETVPASPALPPVRPSDLASLMAEAARPGNKPIAPAPAEPARAPARDSIGQLIRNIDVADDNRPRVLAAQRALIKLGYGPTKADGVAGAETRQAIERFEKDARLPVTGELSARVVRELSATAGLAIE